MKELTPEEIAEKNRFSEAYGAPGGWKCWSAQRNNVPKCDRWPECQCGYSQRIVAY